MILVIVSLISLVSLPCMLILGILGFNTEALITGAIALPACLLAIYLSED